MSSAINRIDNRERKLEAKQNELRQQGLTDEERGRIRDRIREVRAEIRDAHQAARRAEDDLHYAEVEARAVRYSIGGRYGL